MGQKFPIGISDFKRLMDDGCTYVDKGALAPYWVNTNDNALLKQLITQGAEDIKAADLEELVKGNVIEQTIEEGLIFTDLPKKTKAIWSLLLFSGYLSLATTAVYGTPCKLRIPNAEVKEVYEIVIKSWFEEKQYDLELKERGVKRISHLGLAFQNKEVAIRSKAVNV
jgi:hypothetical protein